MTKKSIVQILQEELTRSQDTNPSYSLRAFARKLKLSPGNLSGYMKRQKRMSEETFENMIVTLGLRYDQVISYEQDFGLTRPNSMSSSKFLSPVPFSLPEAADLYEPYLSILKNAVLRKWGHRTILFGLPGVGKSVCAAELVHQRSIQDHFQDGIIWLNVSSQFSPDMLVYQLCSYLGLNQGISSLEESDFRSRVAAIQKFLENKKLLTVCDDVLDSQLIEQLGLTHANLLITTPCRNVARSASSLWLTDVSAEIVTLELLSKKQTHQFLKLQLPMELHIEKFLETISTNAQGQMRSLSKSVTLVLRAFAAGGLSRVEQLLAQPLAPMEDVSSFTSLFCSLEDQKALAMLCFFAPYPAVIREADAKLLLHISPNNLVHLLECGLLVPTAENLFFIPRAVHQTFLPKAPQDFHWNFFKALAQHVLVCSQDAPLTLEFFPHVLFASYRLIDALNKKKFYELTEPEMLTTHLARLLKQLVRASKIYGLQTELIENLTDLYPNVQSPQILVLLEATLSELGKPLIEK